MHCETYGHSTLIREIGIHVRSNHCYLNCLRRLIRSSAVTIGFFFSKKPFFLHACAACSELPSYLSTICAFKSNRSMKFEKKSPRPDIHKKKHHVPVASVHLISFLSSTFSLSRGNILGYCRQFSKELCYRQFSKELCYRQFTERPKI